MKIRWLLSVTVAVMCAPVFACWYSHDYRHDEYYHSFNTGNGYFYLSGVNSDGNHISVVSQSLDSSTGRYSAVYTVANHTEVHLPLTVYVGRYIPNPAFAYPIQNNMSASHFEEPSEMYQTELILTLQYRVLPESGWHTGAAKRFAISSSDLIGKRKIFGRIQIDFSAPAGSTVLIRLHIAGVCHKKTGYDVNIYRQTFASNNANYFESGPPADWWKYYQAQVSQVNNISTVTLPAENFDAESVVYMTASDIPASAQKSSEIGDSVNGLSVPYLGYDAYIMAIRIAGKRRPGR